MFEGFFCSSINSHLTDHFIGSFLQRKQLRLLMEQQTDGQTTFSLCGSGAQTTFLKPKSSLNTCTRRSELQTISITWSCHLQPFKYVQLAMKAANLKRYHVKAKVDIGSSRLSCFKTPMFKK
ncbi:meiotic nuclear division protein 1-like protein [Gossypium australe]|uniref:Meiotic nuclear division protein 1-like protein n=1 Tax=Gossypium australe TaxID=47621 RepID=A0A5B6UKC0_9ROSI|nr:meiotic nuclear division protein 1-like protein [Gossypium australe]